MQGVVSVLRPFTRPSKLSLRRTSAWSRLFTPKTQQRTLTAVSAAELQFGQPLHETHPHLLKSGELTPGITAQEYADRRAKLAKALPNGACAILPASDLKYRAGSVFYEFTQDPDFFYLTGFNEPEALAVIEKTGSDDEHTFHLFVRPKDGQAEKWEGSRSGVEAAEDVFNADETGDISQIPRILPNILQRSTGVYTELSTLTRPSSLYSRYVTGYSKHKLAGLPEIIASLPQGAAKPLRPIMNELRIIKSPSEISNMRTAGRASGRAITAAMRQKHLKEKDLWASLEYNFKINGCGSAAYVPVVGGGSNALGIHYVRNDALLREKDLVLVDAGGEYGGYIADITRTWPVDGKFTAAQQDLYEVILSVQRSCVSMCREDASTSLDKLHSIASQRLIDGMRSIGFEGLDESGLNVLFPHHLGHHVGLDIHDCPGYSRGNQLIQGQCVTIEPGIYVPDDDRWPKHFRGMGIRIEDSVCVDDESPIILTTEAVKEVADIEALRD